MARRKRAKGTASVMPVGIAVGVLIGLCVLGGITFLSTWLIYKEHISMHALGYLLMMGQLIGSLLGTWVAIRRIQRRKAIVGLLTSGGLFLFLLAINAVFFGGHYRGILTTGVLFLIGTALTVFFTGREGHKGYSAKRRNKGLCKFANR